MRKITSWAVRAGQTLEVGHPDRPKLAEIFIRSEAIPAFFHRNAKPEDADLLAFIQL